MCCFNVQLLSLLPYFHSWLIFSASHFTGEKSCFSLLWRNNPSCRYEMYHSVHGSGHRGAAVCSCFDLANKHELNKARPDASISCSPQALSRLHSPWYPWWGGTIEMCFEGKFPTPGYSTGRSYWDVKVQCLISFKKKRWRIKFPGMLAELTVMMSRSVRSRTVCTVISMEQELDACCLTLYDKYRHFHVKLTENNFTWYFSSFCYHSVVLFMEWKKPGKTIFFSLDMSSHVGKFHSIDIWNIEKL